MRLLAQIFHCTTGSNYLNQLSHSLFFWRRYLVHHEQDSKTNTVDTKEDVVMIIFSRSTSKEKAKTKSKDQDSPQEEEENSPNNLTTAKSTANILFLKTATNPNTGTTSKKKKKRRKERNGLNLPEETRERQTQPSKNHVESCRHTQRRLQWRRAETVALQHTTRWTKKAIRSDPSMTSPNRDYQHHLATRH